MQQDHGCIHFRKMAAERPAALHMNMGSTADSEARDKSCRGACFLDFRRKKSLYLKTFFEAEPVFYR